MTAMRLRSGDVITMIGAIPKDFTRTFDMFVITGITGKVGGGIARRLLAEGKKVRAVVRDEGKGAAWKALGCEVALTDGMDADELARAFEGAEGVFLMHPPNYDPAPGFPETRTRIESACIALQVARPGKVVYLSTVGAHVERFSLLSNAYLFEHGLRSLTLPVALLRAGWFMENAAWDLDAARQGVIPSFLQPLEHPIPMVATADISRLAARVLGESWKGTRVLELEGPVRCSARDVAQGFAVALGRPVRAEPVPRDTWDAMFRSQGMQHPDPRIQMLDGFNAGWIDFEGGVAEPHRGQTPLEAVLRELVLRAGH
jgi:uncharacterized protein YbjT (DUF2867 family)